MKNDLRKKAVNGFIFRFMERIGAQSVGFVVSIILARLLSTDDYGLVALATVLEGILSVFIDSGMSLALVQKKDAEDLDFSTFFYFNIFSCLLLYIIVFFSAPFIANFYNQEILTSVIRVSGLTLIISGVRGVQGAHIAKNMKFKLSFNATLFATIGSAIVGIWMAYSGYGVWALIAQNLLNNFIGTVCIWFMVKWRPKLMFSFTRLKGMFTFGWEILVSGLLDTVYNNLRSIVIGKYYSTSNLAFYNKGESVPNLFVTNINNSVSGVLFPALVTVQNDKEELKNKVSRAIKLCTYIMMPVMMGLAVCAEPIVCILFTEKWLPSVPYMRIFCFTFAFYTIHTSNLSAIKAMGRGDLFLRLEIIKKVIGIICIAITVRISVWAMALSLIFTSITSQIINSWPNKKLLDYSYIKQLKDILPGILLSVIMGVCVYPISFLGLSDLVTLIIQVPVGVAVYVGLSALFRVDSFVYLLDLIKNYIPKRK